MNFSRISAAVLVAIAPVVAHAQLNQLLGVMHSVQNAVTQPAQGQSQQSGQDSMQDDQRLAARAQTQQAAMQQQAQQQEQSDNAAYRAQIEQRAAAGRQQAQQMVADQDAKDIAKYRASQQRDQQQAQQQLNDAKKSAAACRTLLDQNMPIAERFIRCRNQGLTEQQQMAFVGAMPVTAQPYIASMVQDVFEDDVTNPARGKAITDYYDACYRRGTPCARPKW
ncbi:hypothetical protein [Paraburkholderia tropica]|uniref:hypothetical protein n=1 Tax=Paraburkholderia tropica TaxID=92647 RepID=UPI002AB26EE8|nr:hypothetical protein [Paraburkholderia tropica]